MTVCCIAWGWDDICGGSVLKGFKPNILAAQLQITV
ncbi:Popeye domain-containing 2 [Gossypium arboreum]|uniref:Popeye domain-containing 2 n=1 Tax=Gossypium arboreum TaxID=29729 RepID=A0A0B0NKM3_GOSAR|nr:Popeye domain-containing 2 [Gossypium arboreum]